eukprot:TRINITY_DN63466_c0_g1_i1.p1 TRINITY_DN63466_c0_g1~~TRINITY_DN63466_c0_g1_i1.p1  ORF type:complete len:319 (-),score=86.53 TRINITY_DN63466_c0_g1_i1:30-938(-)
MAFLLQSCRAWCRPVTCVDDADQSDLPGVTAAVATAEVTTPQAAELPTEQSEEPQDEEGEHAPDAMEGRPLGFGMEEEHRICPVSGLSTLQGACPFAKPKAKAKDGGKKTKVSLKLDFKWEQGESMVSISVRGHPTEAFAALELPDSASKEEIKKQYKVLSLKHHPDKNQDDVDAATDQFQRIKDAYQAIKDTNGELAFPWEQHPDSQQVMSGDEAISMFAKVGMEACEENHFQGLQLRHLVRTSGEVKVLKFDAEKEDGRITECKLEALCMDSKNFVNHLVKVQRRDAWEYRYEDEDAAGG